MRPVISFVDFYNSIWQKIPSVWREADTQNGKPLEILILTLAQHLYYTFYLKIASMDELFDVDRCPAAYLPFLASMLDWNLIGTDEFSWRTQLRSAPLLYKIKGTKKSITLAEKLIGYSVFISELWRDYTGQIVPKEKLWNNFPEEIKVKPWFRHFSPDIQKDIQNPSFSDLLPSYNSSSIESVADYYNQTSNSLLDTYSIPTSSSTPQYNPITGEGSASKLAKASRINVVLKKDLDLDYNLNGVYTDSNLSEALDLFLKFKPFHVYINEFLVMYSLSDYVFGSVNEPSGGTGDISSDSIIYREDSSIEAAITPDAADESIKYYNPAILNTITNPEVSVDDPSLLKGSLKISMEIVSLVNLEIENETEYLKNLGFSLAGYALNIPITQGSKLWIPSDFVSAVKSRNYWTPEEIALNAEGTTPSWLIDIYTNSIPYELIKPAPDYSFLSYSTPLTNSCSFSQLFGYTDDVSIHLSDFGDYKDSLTVNGVSYNSYNRVAHTPVSLIGYTPIWNIITSYFSNVGDLYTGNKNTDLLNWTKYLFSNNLLIFCNYANHITVLTEKLHYSYDSINKKLVFNIYNIVQQYQFLGIPESDLVASTKLYVVYPSILPNEESYNIDNITRNTNISTRKENTKFNRIDFVDNSQLQTYIQTAQYTPEQYFDTESGTLLIDEQKTRKFKSDLPYLFSRTNLATEDPTGTAYKAINFDPLSPRDTTEWTVLVSPSSIYNGSEPVSTSTWSNYFNLPIESSFYLTKYSSIDFSAETQTSNRESTRWQTYLSLISDTDPGYFFSSRENTMMRNILWTRGSASKLAIPYKGNSRETIQGYRKDTALFDRTTNLGDYSTSLNCAYGLDKYGYVDTKQINMTNIYKDASNPIEIKDTPTTEILYQFIDDSNKFKTTISTDSTNTITYPILTKVLGAELNYTPEYENPFDFVDRSLYYDKNKNLKPSFYANNIRTDLNPYTGTLFTDFFDLLDLNISGTLTNQEFYVITDTTINSFLLHKQNLFIVWKNVNTGLTLNIGENASPIYTQAIIPNIKVIKNGIELVYGDFWTVSSTPYQILLTSNCILNLNDTIELVYDTLDSVTLPTAPYFPDPVNPINYIYCDSNNTESKTDTHSILVGVNTRWPIEFTFNNNPIISWYINPGSPEFISSSVDIKTTLVAHSPLPLLHRDTAYPDVVVVWNSTADSQAHTLIYGTDWHFTSVPSPTSFSYRIVIHQKIVQYLLPTDTVVISYNSIATFAVISNKLSIYSFCEVNVN